MKLSKILTPGVFFVFFPEHGAAIEKSFVLTPDPVCIEFNEFNLEGRSEFVDTDNSGIPPTFIAPLITTGDMQISAYSGKFSLSSGYTGSKFKLQQFNLQAVCTTLEDQTTPSAPECRIEIDLKFCRKLIVIAFPYDIIKTTGRNLRETQGDLFDKKYLSVEELDALIDENDPQIDAETFRRLDSESQQKISNFCYGTREGKLTAVGTGPEKYAITGGTRDFFGAFGQVDFALAPDFSHLDYDPTTGDVNLLLNDAKLQFCYERACGFGKFDCH
eukprot:7819105-Ditylum_brightwellii.AAC.1